MKEIWVLTVKTSLPDICVDCFDWETTVKAFGTFEDAKAALFEKFHELAFSENAMFDGNGGLKNFNDYIEGIPEDVEEFEDSLTIEKACALRDLLEGLFAGKQCDISQHEGTYTDCTISIAVDDGRMTIQEDEYGPEYGPKLITNMFDMTSENKNYRFYLNDLFGQEASAELYIDLVKSCIE